MIETAWELGDLAAVRRAEPAALGAHARLPRPLPHQVPRATRSPSAPSAPERRTWRLRRRPRPARRRHRRPRDDIAAPTSTPSPSSTTGGSSTSATATTPNANSPSPSPNATAHNDAARPGPTAAEEQRHDSTAQYLTVAEAAEYLNTSVRFVRRLIAERRIAFHHVGRHVRIARRRPGGLRPGRAGRADDAADVWRDLRGWCVMANGRHRRFGYVRRLPSGRYRPATSGRTGGVVPLRNLRPEEGRRPLARACRVADHAGGVDRPGRGPRSDSATTPSDGSPSELALRPRTVELYRWLLGKHIAPQLGAGRARRSVHGDDPASGAPTCSRRACRETMAAKSYRLLRAVLNTAVDEDRIIPRNPCRVRGADRENPAERPVLTVAQVFELADAMRIPATACADPRHRVHHPAMGRGDRATPQRRRRGRELGAGRASRTPRWSGAGSSSGRRSPAPGVRTVAVPAAIRGDIVEHLMTYVDAGPDALVFTGPKGGALRRAHFNNLTRWVETVAELGVPGPALPRPAAHRQPLGRADRGQHHGPDGPDGARRHARRTDLPARHERGGPTDRRPAQRLVDEHEPAGRPDDEGRGCRGTGAGAAEWHVNGRDRRQDRTRRRPRFGG